MEPWKVLLLVAAVPTLASLVLSYQNQDALKAMIANRDAQTLRVDTTKSRLGQTKQESENTGKETATLEQESDSLKNQLATTQAQASELDLRIKTVTEDIAAATKKIAGFQGLKTLMVDIDQFEAKLASVETEITDLEEGVTNTKNLLAVNDAKKEQSDRSIKAKEAMDTYRRTGQNWAPINSQVTAAFNDWGFVVIGAGDDQNISNAAILDVSRDGKPVCKLIVTEVQLNQAIADIVPNSLVPGQQVQIGDRVTKPAAVSLPN